MYRNFGVSIGADSPALRDATRIAELAPAQIVAVKQQTGALSI